MDEQPRRLRTLLFPLWLLLALVIMVPVVVLLGMSLYVRAAAVGLVGLIRFLLGRKPAFPVDVPTQPPHFSQVELRSIKNQE